MCVSSLGDVSGIQCTDRFNMRFPWLSACVSISTCAHVCVPKGTPRREHAGPGWALGQLCVSEVRGEARGFVAKLIVARFMQVGWVWLFGFRQSDEVCVGWRVVLRQVAWGLEEM